jgi:hypothetical protein
MDILTLYVAQGSLAAVRSGQEVLIIDAHMHDCDDVTQEEIEATLDVFIGSRTVRGLILTGLYKDHACPAGVDSILARYCPEWVMYPKCFKDTDAATEVFRIIDREVNRRGRTVRPLTRKWVRLFSAKTSHAVYRSFFGCVKCCQEEI